MRLVVAILLGCLTATASPQPARAAYSVTALPEGFEANCINNLGEVVGTLGSFPAELAVWRDGVLETLPNLPGHDVQEARDCNDRGQVLGWTFSNGEGRRVLWTDGIPEEVPELHIGNNGRPLNNLGDGVMQEFSPARRDGIWNADGTFTLVDPGTGTDTVPFGINDSRLVVGTTAHLVPPNFERRPFLWMNGQTTHLTPPSLAGWSFRSATSLFVNNAGQVFARVSFVKGNPTEFVERLFYWKDGTMLNLGFPGSVDDGSIVPRDLNNKGVVVGWSTFGGAFMADSSGFLEIEIDPSDPLAVDPSEFTPVSINDAGKLLLVGGIGSLLLTPGEAPHRFVNAAGGSWDEPSNWEPAEVPGSADTVLFDLPVSYAVDFPGAAAAPAARGPAGSCASTRPIQAKRIRAGAVSFRGAVDVSTLSDAPSQPGLRIGGETISDSPRLTLESGQLCSVFATLGDTGRGVVEVRAAGGDWRNEARLRVGDAGPARLEISAESLVAAAETRVGRFGGGAIAVLEGELDAGSLLIGAPELALGTTAEVNVELGHLRTDSVLIGAALGICLNANGTETTGRACAQDADCLGVGREACSRSQVLRVDSGASWAADAAVAVGGGAVADEDGILQSAPGSGLLFLTGQGILTSLSLGNDTADPAGTAVTLSSGEAVIGEGGVLDVLGKLDVGEGGVGRLIIEGTGRVEAAGTTSVGLPSGKPENPSVLHGLLDIRGEAAAPSTPASLMTPLLEIRRSGRAVLRSGVLDAIVVVEAAGAYLMADAGARIGGGVECKAGSRCEFFPAGGEPRGPIARAAALPGSLIEGDLVIEPGAVLAVRMGAADACTPVQVGGNATLLGALELVFEDGYLPAEGDACEVLSVDGATTGSFARVAVRGVAEGFTYATTPGPGGTLAFQALSSASPCAGGDQDGDGVADCERCDNCVDDNDNGLVDREDPDCVPAADGGGVGLADADEGRELLRCHAALRSASKQLASQSWKPHQKCADAMLRCHQRKPDDPRCPEKVAAKCGRAAEKLAGEKGPTAKAQAAIVKACGALPLAALREAAGLGHEGAEGACSGMGVADLDGVDAVATCIVRRQRCQVGEFLGAVVPRASELLGAAGMVGTLPCLGAGADGTGGGLGDPKGAGKRAAVCQKAAGRAAEKLLGRAVDTGGRCEGAVLACLQLQPGDAACLAKARARCEREDDRLAAAEAQFSGAIERKCGERKGSALVSTEDLLAATGLGFAGVARRCEALGIAPLASSVAIGACLRVESSCREAIVREAATPRSEELLRLGAPSPQP